MKNFNFMNQLIRCVSGASLNLFRCAAMVVVLLTLGIGNAWAGGGSSNYYASLKITKAGITAAGKVYVAKASTKPSSEVTTAVTSDATTSSGGSRTFYYWVDVTSPGYYVTLSGDLSGTYNGNTGQKSVSLNAATSADQTKAYTATATFSEITINNGTASPATIAAEDNSATATTNTCTVTYSTKGDNANDFKAPTVGSATGHGTFTAALGSVTSAGAATVNVTFKGDGTYGGNVEAGSRSRTSSAVVTLTSAVGNIKGTCTVTASFPNIAIGDGSFDHMTTINTVPKSATATFPVQWADDAEDFSASFGSATGGGVWTVDDVTYTATDARSGTISIDYTFNPNGAEGDHSAVLTLAANTNAGGASKTLTLTAEAEALAAYDASIGDTKYTTLAAAITAANGMNTNPTVKILRNVEGLTSTLEIKKPMTIDLNSFTVSGTLTSSVNKLFYLNTATAVLTINDSRNGGKISATGNAAAALTAVLVDKGSVVLTKGDIEINNTNTGASANAIAVCIMAGARFGMTGGNLNAVAAGTGAYGVMTTTNPADVDMIGITGGTITAAAATTGVGIYCKSSSTTLPSDPTNANVALSGVTIDASATGVTAHAVQTDAGVILGINSGTYNATVATTTARAVLSKGYTAVMNGTFNATAGTTDANAIRVEAGIVAVRAGLFNATTVQRIAHAGYVANGAKLLTYGGTFHGKSTTMIANGYATGTQVVSGGTLEAQGGTFIGEAANTGLGAAQTSYAIGVFANTGSNVTLANATLRGLTDNTYVNGSYGLYTLTTNAVNLTNCTLEVSGQYQYGYGIRNNGTPLSVKNSEITVNTQYAYNYGIYQEGNTTTYVENTTITCEANSVRAHAIWVNNGQVNATNCSLTAKTKQATATAEAESNLRAVYVNTGKKVSLNGCTVTAKGNANYSQNGYGLYIDGSADIDNTTVTVSDVKTNANAIGNTANTTLVAISSGKFSATAASGTIVSTNGTAAAAKQQLYGGYYKQNTNLAKYLPEGYMVETLTAGTEFNAGYKYHVRPEIVVPDPVCKINSTGYATLEEALDFVNKNSGTAYTIYMVKNYTLPAGDYTLPAKATLLVPMSGQTTSIGTSLARVTSAVTRSCNVQLTFATGVNLTAFGTIETGSRQCAGSGATGFQTGSYGRIHMNEGSRIDMESGSKIYCWGYITGKGVVNAKDGSIINEQFELGDFKGGGVASNMLNNSYKVFLVTHYFYQSIEADVIYRPGSQALGYSTAAISSSANDANGVKIVGETGSGALFLMDAKDMREDTWLKKEYDPATERAVWTLNSGATLGSLSINISGANMQSANYILPISSQMDLKLNYGEMTLNQSTYFMPGSSFEIGREATLKIPSGKELYFIDQENWVKGYSVTNYLCTPNFSPTRSGNGPRDGMKSNNTNIPDAEFFIHGTVEVTGSFFTSGTGANLHSTNADAGKVVFKSAAAANKSFYQCNSNCGKEGLFSYYWNRQEHACTSAKLKNGDGTYVATAGNTAGTKYIYKDDQWVKIVTDGCLEVQTISGIDHKYAYTTEFVEVAENAADNAYHDAAHSEGAEGCRYFVYTKKAATSEGCVWWEATKEGEGLYKAILPDHNGKINYYTFDAGSGYWTIKTVTIKWLNTDTDVDDYTIAYNTVPKYLDASPTKASTATDYYTWLGWTKGSENGEFFAKDAELPVATENTTYYAYFKADKFTFRATFNNYDGSLLETKLVAAGETPVYEGETPPKPATTSKEYTFTGWSPALAAISNAPVTYTAQFSEKTREYTVQWVNYNGTVLKEEKVAYGTTPTAPVTPTRPNDNYYTYTFVAWSPAIASVGGDQTYTATYNYEKQVPKYTATFMNGSETVYAPSLKSGDVPVFDGTTPTKTADAQYTYTFDGWSTSNGGALVYAAGVALPALTGDVTYYAHFATSTNNYRIIWKSENGKVTLETDPTVPYGTTPSFDGATPTKDRMGATVYTFDGWSAAIGGAKITLQSVAGNATYYAHFSDDPVYTVTFNANGHGTAPEAQEVVSGQKVTEPAALTEVGYTFGGWYKEAGCTNEWNFASDVVTEATPLYAKWTANTHKLSWNFNGGTPSGSYTEANNALAYGSTITYPTLSKMGYTFAGWSTNATSMPDADLTITASWTPNTNTAYTVKHYKQKLDGTYASTPDETDNLTGTTAAEVTPARKSYEGFEAPAGQTVTILADGSSVVIYQYTRNNYTLTIGVNEAGYGSVDCASVTVPYGSTIAKSGNAFTVNDITITATPVDKTAKYDYALDHWNNLPNEVLNDVNVQAVFTRTTRTYAITWKNKNGSTLRVDQVAYDEWPEYGSVPTCDPTESQVFEFRAWTPEITAVQGAKTYTADYTASPRQYPVIWKNYDGSALKTIWHKYGWEDIPAADTYDDATPTRPTENGKTYTFKGWSNPVSTVEGGDVTYTAQYSSVLSATADEDVQVTEGGDVTKVTVGGENSKLTIGDENKHVEVTTTITVVENGGELVVTNGSSIGEEDPSEESIIIVESGGQLNVEVGGSVEADVFIIQATTEDKVVTQEVTTEVQVSGELSETGTKNIGAIYYDLTRKHGAENFLARVWYAVAVPWAVDVPNYSDGGVYIKRGEEFIPQRLGATFDLLSYDGACRATNGASANCWVYLEDEIDAGTSQPVMVPGKLYMIYLTEETSTIRFKKKAGEAIHTNTLTVSAHTETSNANDANWNGIANPATYKAYMNVSTSEGGLVQTFVPGTQPRDGGHYMAMDLDGRQAVGQPFFVQVDPAAGAATSVTVTRNNNNPSAPAPRRAQAAEDKEVRYAIGIAANGKLADRLYIQTAEEKEDKYVIGKDMSKMSISSSVAQIWVERYDAKLCLNTVAMARDKAVYPLGIYAPQAGEYMIFAPEDMEPGDNIYLTLDGRVIWNLTYSPYYASLEQGTTTRYGLRIVRDNTSGGTTGVDEVHSGDIQCEKVIMDDHVYILRGEELYTVTGQKAK